VCYLVFGVGLYYTIRGSYLIRQVDYLYYQFVNEQINISPSLHSKIPSRRAFLTELRATIATPWSVWSLVPNRSVQSHKSSLELWFTELGEHQPVFVDPPQLNLCKHGDQCPGYHDYSGLVHFSPCIEGLEVMFANDVPKSEAVRGQWALSFDAYLGESEWRHADMVIRMKAGTLRDFVWLGLERVEALERRGRKSHMH
jgi:hypothetical protein